MPTEWVDYATVLEEAGIEYVFGIPSGATGPIYTELYGMSSKIRTILTRHEQTAAIMADAYGRATGRRRWCTRRAVT